MFLANPIRHLAPNLERNPDSLLRGSPKKGGQSRKNSYKGIIFEFKTLSNLRKK